MLRLVKCRLLKHCYTQQLRKKLNYDYQIIIFLKLIYWSVEHTSYDVH